jgi:hypothetical protein
MMGHIYILARAMTQFSFGKDLSRNDTALRGVQQHVGMGIQNMP